ncbi:MAG: hypothetical protein K8F34_03740 [Candidatus Kuenenia stuttgartiensis]|uniref:hypothetical protein n=1 Tax=Candidatus Kuenenia TaxID=380738 RepID=UPI000C07B4DA|nr:hypothetical protein [Candidatus Kuenenia stuttgartiensis]MBE7546101.1 hypothetical protein [Planctomycetia bacterium]MBZ0190788.1 hypothetical protein [Candidatus Kuenenia stuttgartiensis]MCF6152521.1 hypothetical protein [Candidatus Kuenenia stuttgartiensis]GJQ50254.1 MAG: hypothetical protein HKUEN01_26400 [Candidatus Kuenenia stuttgartiensis]
MTNKFQIPNRDFVIWELAFYHSTWPHYTHKLIGSGYKPEPARSRVMFTLNSYDLFDYKFEIEMVVICGIIPNINKGAHSSVG